MASRVKAGVKCGNYTLKENVFDKSVEKFEDSQNRSVTMPIHIFFQWRVSLTS